MFLNYEQNLDNIALIEGNSLFLTYSDLINKIKDFSSYFDYRLF